MNLISDNTNTQAPTSEKKSYERPGVTTFGSVAKLTQGKNGTLNDVGQNNNTRKGGQPVV